MKPQIKTIPIHSISLGLDVFQVDYDKIIKVAETLRNHGLIEPIAVRFISGSYYLILGKIRYLAAILVGLKEIPVMIIDGENHGKPSNQSDLKNYVNSKLRLLNFRPTKLSQRNIASINAKAPLRKIHLAFARCLTHIISERR
jgi:hypothetical protein